MSSRASRKTICTGPSIRSSSSTASATRSGSARRRAVRAGLRTSHSTPLAMRLVVVSCPAKRTNIRVWTISSSLRCAPSRSRSWVKSSRGDRRCSSTRVWKRAAIARAARAAPPYFASCAVFSTSPSTKRPSWSDQCLSCSRSSRGIPKSSAMTMAGSGWAKSATRSIRPSAPSGSRSSSTTARTFVSSTGTSRARNAFCIARRSSRWRGGSLNTIQSARVRARSATSAWPSPPPRSFSNRPIFSTDSLGSRRARRTSAWRVRTQPPSEGLQCAGARSRRRL